MNLGQGGRLLVGLPTEEFRLLGIVGDSGARSTCFRTSGAGSNGWRGAVTRCSRSWRSVPARVLRHLRDLHSTDPLWSHAPRGGTVLDALRRHFGIEEPLSEHPVARLRLAVLLIAALLGLGMAWVAVEGLQDLRVTLFQPFRMATVARGLSLVALAGHVLALWRRGDLAGRGRAALLTVGLAGDWAFVVATLVELAVAAIEACRAPGFGQSGAIARRGTRMPWIRGFQRTPSLLGGPERKRSPRGTAGRLRRAIPRACGISRVTTRNQDTSRCWPRWELPSLAGFSDAIGHSNGHVGGSRPRSAWPG